MAEVYTFCFFVPETDAEAVKDAVFAAGAGRLGNYDKCAWQTSGRGQFRPLAGSSPYIGNCGKLETVSELRVEMICSAAALPAAIAALQQAHPYETPAFQYWPIKTGNITSEA